MNSFRYIGADSPAHAVALAGTGDRFLAGGIDLLGEMKDYIVSPGLLVDVKGMAAAAGQAAFDAITLPTGAPDPKAVCRLGATVTVAAVAAHGALGQALPGLAQAAGEIGSPQIRNVATVAGNLLQHSRCWYYRQPDLVCLKRGGSECYAQKGENKYLSLFSGCECISPVVSSLSVILTALDASIEVTGGKRSRLSLHELYHEAWKNPHVHHALQPRELITGIEVPLHRTRSAYRQVSERAAFDWALVSCAAAGNVVDGVLRDARVVLGAVAPVPYMVAQANAFLEGKPLNDATVAQAADLLLHDAKPLAQNGYKLPLAHALIRRTLLALNA
jgi:xanthine dehydrogenase YagS FAD-binding subunit